MHPELPGESPAQEQPNQIPSTPGRQTTTNKEETDIFHTPAQHPEFLNNDVNEQFIFYTKRISMAQPVNNQSFMRDLSQALWTLELPNNEKLDGEDVDVQEFCSRLSREVEMAQFTGTALTWLYMEVDCYETFDEFLEALVAWFGTKQTMSQLNDQEKKYAFLEGHQKPSMKSITVKGKRWDKATITFDDLVDKVYEQHEQGMDDGDLSSHRRIQELDLKKIAEEAARSAAQETTTSLGKELASIKQELRLTSASRKNPGKPIFLAEDDGDPNSHTAVRSKPTDGRMPGAKEEHGTDPKPGHTLCNRHIPMVPAPAAKTDRRGSPAADDGPTGSTVASPEVIDVPCPAAEHSICQSNWSNKLRWQMLQLRRHRTFRPRILPPRPSRPPGSGGNGQMTFRTMPHLRMTTLGHPNALMLLRRPRSALCLLTH
ncbi:hypothetical protein DFJ77DRAFT_440516 [Powellomyces hirtus]|nr:hypothetical protein DFJ77DRAFT_440516 [Powellomyces hirtus]